MGCFKKKDNKKKTDLDELKKEVDIDDHKIPLEELLKRLSTDKKTGISESDAANRLKEYGPNSLTPPHKKSVLFELMTHLFGGFNFLLWGAGFFSFLAYILEISSADEVPPDNLYMGIILVVIVTITGLFSFYQNRTSANIMESFANMIPTTAHVIREGKFLDIKVDEVVIGDLVTFSGGDKIPADVRIIDARGLKVDNSSLTGESEPQTRTPECTHSNPLETKNIAMFSTSVIEGTGIAIVIQTGDKTVMGRIAALTSQVETGTTPIAKEIHHFIRVIGCVAATVATTCFAISLVNGANVLEAIVFMMGIFVANVPEGITATVTASLTLTAKKMRRKFCLVKNLEAVETLGSTSTICSDKTGTLTQNRMTVTHIWVNEKIVNALRISENGDIKGAEKAPAMEGTYGDLMRCAALCSRSHFKDTDPSIPIPKRKTVGDASEVAILKYCELIHTMGDVNAKGVEKWRLEQPKVCEIPFNSNNKYQLSIHLMKNNSHILVMKGAPEKILSLCTTMSLKGENIPLTSKMQANFTKAYEELGGYGERVLGFCDIELNPKTYPKGYEFDQENPNFPTTGYRFLGLISLIDPPRPGVPMAVRLCQSAGIKVVMVTGDHPITARAIANQVHIIEDESSVTELIADDPHAPIDEAYGNGRLKETDAIVVHGEQLRKLSETTLDSIVQNYSQVVFARTSPTQKLQIVEAYQRCKQVVAVTGDGVNDAPALRKADIGIAMGIAGTDVSKQAADMILLNDNFASIVTGVEEGRIIFDNLKKSIAYTLTSNIGEVTPFISYVVFGIPLPMSLIAILLIDMGTDLWPAISLAYELPENDIMKRPPRDARYDKLVNSRLIIFSYLHIGVMQASGGFCTYFAIMLYNGFKPLDLLHLKEEWDNEFYHSVTDSFNQQWSYSARKDLEHSCHAAFFMTMVIVQWADLFISKTRKNSIVVQGLQNRVMNMGMMSTVVLASIFLYTPYLQKWLTVCGLRLATTIIALPFALMIFMYDEIRKYFIRTRPGGYIYRQTNY